MPNGRGPASSFATASASSTSHPPFGEARVTHRKMGPLLLRILIATLVACSPPAKSMVAPVVAPVVASQPSPLPSSTDSSLPGVDWCNRGYGATHPTLADCRGTVEQRHRAGEGMWGVEHYKLATTVYGDLTGDGHEDALIVLETTLRPVLIQPNPPAARAELWLIERQGTELILYTTESAETVPTSVSIANGAATLVWNQDGRRCTAEWRFAGVGQTAVKSARRCTP